MSSLDLTGIDWLGHGWLLLLSFTVAVLLVAALRKPCRHLFGTERAFQLWLLPPLAMLVSQMPHAATTQPSDMPSVVYVMTAAVASSARATTATNLDWRTVVLLCWLAGIVVALAVAGRAQWCYRRRLRGATPVAESNTRWPVLRAASPDVGPALVGAWRARIVLPLDFEQRYDRTEQALILAHEAMHAQRRDGWSCLFAQIIAAVFWFHPLAWWALSALRHDQELACDAAVLRGHGAQRRSYVNAMLKTQSAALALPVGCPWSPRHPITERVAMLKSKSPSPTRRGVGAALIALLAGGIASAVYAAVPSPAAQSGNGVSDRYTLKIDVAMGGHPESTHFTRCVRQGKSIPLSGTDGDKLSWKGSFAVSPATAGQLEIRAQIDTRFDRGAGKVRTMSGKPIVRTMPGQPATIVFGQVIDGSRLDKIKLEDNTIKIRVTPREGCESGSLLSAWQPVTTSQRGEQRGAREMAEAVAAKAGLVLVNPEALDNRAVSLNFEQVQATAALQLIADIDDKRVRFETK